MFLPYKLFCLELSRNGCWKLFLQYRKVLRKFTHHSLRVGFIENCIRASIIPRFLKFRIPNNGCFDDRSIHEFQLRLLRKELHNAKKDLKETFDKVSGNREKWKQILPFKCIPSVILHSRIDIRTERKKQMLKLNDKLYRLSKERKKDHCLT